MSITIEHVRKAIDWAIEARNKPEPTPLDGVCRKYDQGTWDCGTACCIWGAASLIAGDGPAKCGPDHDSLGESKEARIAIRLMNRSTSKPEHIRAALNGECDDSGNWNCKDCSGCSDCSYCSGCSDCSYCSGCSDCSYCSGCSGCSGCSDCSYCSDCSDCSYCSDWHKNAKRKPAEPSHA